MKGFIKKSILIIAGIVALFVLVSCKENDEVHVHNYVVQASGQIRCIGCSEHIDNNYIAIVDEYDNVLSYVLLTDSNSSTGLTVEENKVAYANIGGSSRSIVFYTTSNQSLTINAPDDDVTHFGEVKDVNIIAVADNSYHGKATVEESITVAQGNIELEVSVPQVKVEATGNVSVNLGKEAKVESLSVETKEGTALQTVKVGGSGTVEKLEAATPIKIETKVEKVEVKSEEVSITLSGNAEVTEVKVDEGVGFTSEKKLEINIEGEAKVEGVTGVDSTALETTTEPGAEPVHIHVWDSGKETTKATCTTDGVRTYSCTNGSCKETKTEVIKALGHKYGEPTWDWSVDCSTATAKFTCANDSKHVETVNARVSSAVTAATCTDKGNTKYTATVSFNGKEYKSEKDVEIAVLGHSYGTPTYTWSDDYKCTATRVCTHDASHKETETVQGVYSELTIATCSITGSGKYTATFTIPAFEQQVKNVVIPKLMHIFDQEKVDAKYLKSVATCSSKAVYYKSCSCGEASTTETFEYGEPIEHSFDDYGVCIACGYNKNEQYLIIENGVLKGITQNFSGGLTIPEGVVSIDSGSEEYCIFDDCSITKVRMPSSLRTIGLNAFCECTTLKEITIPNGVVEIGESAFDTCEGLEGELIIPGNVKIIGEDAFEDCKGITSLILSNGIESIGDEAFAGCSGIDVVIIPNSVKLIGEDAFDCSELSVLIIDNVKDSVKNAPWGAPDNTEVYWKGGSVEPQYDTVFYPMMVWNYEYVDCMLSVEEPDNKKGLFQINMYGQEVSGNYEITPNGITASWYEGSEYLATGKIQKNRNEQFDSFEEFKSASSFYLFIPDVISSEGWEESDTAHWVSANCQSNLVAIHYLQEMSLGSDYVVFRIPDGNKMDLQMLCLGDPDVENYKFYIDRECKNEFDSDTIITKDTVLYCSKIETE